MLESTDHVHCHAHKDDGDDDCRGYCDRLSCDYGRWHAAAATDCCRRHGLLVLLPMLMRVQSPAVAASSAGAVVVTTVYIARPMTRHEDNLHYFTKIYQLITDIELLTHVKNWLPTKSHGVWHGDAR